MQLIDTRWLPSIAWLASDRLLLSKHNPILHLAIKDYQQYIDTLLRKEDIELMIQDWQPGGKHLTVESCLSRLADHFLIWQGNRFEVKDQSLESWLALCSLIDPSWIIAWGYCQLLNDGVLDIAEIEDLVGQRQCPVALQKPSSDKAYADNHVHLGGHGHTSHSMLDITLYMNKSISAADSQWPHRAEYTLLESDCSLDKKDLLNAVALFGRSLGNRIFGHKPADICLEALAQNSLNEPLQLEMDQRNFEGHAQQLIAAAHLSEYSSIQRWLFYCIGLLCHQTKDDHYQCQLEQFIRSSNILRNYMVVSGVGLGQFVEYFGFKHRKPQSGKPGMNAKQAALTYDIEQNTQRQFRVSPDVVVKAKRRTLPVQVRPNQLKKMAQQLIEENQAGRCHFVIHFTRGYPKNYTRGDNRFEETRQDLRAQVSKLSQFQTSVDYAQQEIGNDGQKVDLRQLIRGYDVAGNENQLPIEVFAPALRVLSSGKYKAKGPFTSRFAKPFLTVHSGEDFSHLPSGLRAIDEAVTFCDLTKDDRLGHALALGLDADLWAKRQKRVYLTVGEHFDNLVWTYHQALHMDQYSGQFNAVTQLLSHKIQCWADYLGLGNYSYQQFYQAWLLRRNCPVSYNLNPDAGCESLWLPDAHALSQEQSERPKTLWRDYINGDLPRNGRREKVVSCTATDDNLLTIVPDEQLSDNLSKGELKLYGAIQDMLMDKYSRLGIIIEACPTSNIYIGRFKEYHEHPLFRWDPPDPEWIKPGQKYNLYGLRRGAVPVCINTDDSALMPTTIANEHRVMEKAAIDHFAIGTSVAERWIERIRQRGVEVFNSKHLDWSNESS